jgi:uncharacterized protein YndB with AHSA1/START domain
MTAARERFVFRQAVQVSVEITASPDAVWNRLTDAAAFPAWNSTVASVDRPIELGRRLAIRVPAAPGRTFRPTVVAFEPPRRMTWREGALPMFRGSARSPCSRSTAGVRGSRCGRSFAV